MAKKISLIHRVQKNQKGLRLDVVAAKAFPEFSRNNIQKWIKKGELTLNGSSSKSKQLLRGTELLEIQAERIEVVEDLPEEINLDILFEDEDIMVINKKPGLVVHPGAGNKSGTLVNGILNHNPSQAYLPRAGIVHRLDKETSGLMVIAKNESSYLNFIETPFVYIYGALIYDYKNMSSYFNWRYRDIVIKNLDICKSGVPVRDLPKDCLEKAENPEELFSKHKT